MDAVSFLAWVEVAQPGDRIEYHRGCIASDRVIDPRLDALADLIYAEANATWWRMSPCQHARGLLRGTKRIRLAQNKLGPDHWRYLAERTHVDVRPIPPCVAQVRRLEAEVECLRRLLMARGRARPSHGPEQMPLPGLGNAIAVPIEIGIMAFSRVPVSARAAMRLAA